MYQQRRQDEQGMELRLEAERDEVTAEDLREYFAFLDQANAAAEARAAEIGMSFGGGW